MPKFIKTETPLFKAIDKIFEIIAKDIVIEPLKDLNQAFYNVCHNEMYATYRDFEEDFGPVCRAIMKGDLLVHYEDIKHWDNAALQRAGYLLDFVTGLVDDDVYYPQRPTIDKIMAHMQPSDYRAIAFFHSDLAGGHDMIAKQWHLIKGMNISRFKQITTPPYIT